MHVFKVCVGMLYIYMYILQYFLKTAKCSIRTSTYIYNITVMLVSSSCCANHTQKRNEQIEIQRGATSLSGCLQLLACRVVAKTKRLILIRCQMAKQNMSSPKGSWKHQGSWFFLSPQTQQASKQASQPASKQASME